MAADNAHHSQLNLIPQDVVFNLLFDLKFLELEHLGYSAWLLACIGLFWIIFGFSSQIKATQTCKLSIPYLSPYWQYPHTTPVNPLKKVQSKIPGGVGVKLLYFWGWK